MTDRATRRWRSPPARQHRYSATSFVRLRAEVGRRTLSSLGVALVMGIVDLSAVVAAITYVAWQAAHVIVFLSRRAIRHRTNAVTVG